jgi:hypothetical protein
MIDVSPRPPEMDPEYLGDAVHARFDGWQIELRTEDDRRQVIYLEPSVYRALVAFAVRVGVDKRGAP